METNRRKSVANRAAKSADKAIKAPKQASESQSDVTGEPSAQDAERLLKSDHRKVETLFQQYENAASAADKTKLARQVCTELAIHTMLEEEIFYPACRVKGVDSDILDKAQVEHDGAKVLIAELMSQSPEDEFYDAKVTVLSDYIKHHVGEEEKPSGGIFAKAREAGLDMGALGQRLQARKIKLSARAEADGLNPPSPRSLHLEPLRMREEDDIMNRQSNVRERDDRGRFTSDDDDRGDFRGRDDYGRFTRGGGGRGGSRASGSRYSSRSDRYDYEDDDRSGGSRGWVGDPEGHAEAARRGWEERGYSRSRSRDDDDDRGYSRSRYSSRGRDDDDDDDRRSSSRGRHHGGWYGDAEGHAEAAERGWEERGYSRSRSRDDDDDRGYSRPRYSSRGRDDDDDDDRRSSSRGRRHGGWYGDPQGHAEAAERGWEERGYSRSRSRSRDDEDDRRSSRSGGRDHGGWFGDSRGHAEAARRGWENRD
jgi:hypothetical protein